jgi:hypothetical protein
MLNAFSARSDLTSICGRLSAMRDVLLWASALSSLALWWATLPLALSVILRQLRAVAQRGGRAVSGRRLAHVLQCFEAVMLRLLGAGVSSLATRPFGKDTQAGKCAAWREATLWSRAAWFLGVWTDLVMRTGSHLCDQANRREGNCAPVRRPTLLRLFSPLRLWRLG